MKERNVERHKGDIQHDPSNTHFAIFFFFQQYRNTKLEKRGHTRALGRKWRTLISHLLLKINVQYRGLPNCETNIGKEAGRNAFM